ncbi:hypothetical protein D3C78_1021910 [compost metagenome]
MAKQCGQHIIAHCAALHLEVLADPLRRPYRAVGELDALYQGCGRNQPVGQHQGFAATDDLEQKVLRGVGPQFDVSRTKARRETQDIEPAIIGFDQSVAALSLGVEIEVGTAPADQPVVTRTALKGVVAVPRRQGVVAGIAQQGIRQVAALQVIVSCTAYHLEATAQQLRVAQRSAIGEIEIVDDAAVDCIIGIETMDNQFP